MGIYSSFLKNYVKDLHFTDDLLFMDIMVLISAAVGEAFSLMFPETHSEKNLKVILGTEHTYLSFANHGKKISFAGHLEAF